MNHLIENTPFIVLFGLGAAIVMLTFRLLGIKASAGVLAFLGAVFLFREGRKDGRQSQVQADRKEAANAVNQATAARVDAAVRDADPERLRDDDGFRRD